MTKENPSMHNTIDITESSLDGCMDAWMHRHMLGWTT